MNTESKKVFVVTQRDPDVEQPGRDDLYEVGTEAIIRRMERSENALVQLIAVGAGRARLTRILQSDPFLIGETVPLPMVHDASPETRALMGAVLELASEAVELAEPGTQIDLRQLLGEARDPWRVVFVLASLFSIDTRRRRVCSRPRLPSR